jgi:hypothetical protein
MALTSFLASTRSREMKFTKPALSGFIELPGIVDLLPLLYELIDGVAAFLNSLLWADIFKALSVNISYQNLVARSVVPVSLKVIDLPLLLQLHDRKSQ